MNLKIIDTVPYLLIFNVVEDSCDLPHWLKLNRIRQLYGKCRRKDIRIKKNFNFTIITYC